MVKTYDCIPNSTIFTESENELTLLDSPLIELLVNLRYNLRDKLNIANTIINSLRKSVKGLFSQRDIVIIKKILNKKLLKKPKMQAFNIALTKIVNDNYIDKNIDTKIIQDLINLEYLIELDNNKKYEYFYKWVDFTNCKREKIITIINNEIYLASPTEFNDKLDCQLHLNEDYYLSLNNNHKHGIDNIKFFEFLSVKLLIATSFSLNNAYNINSTNMWGIYGGNGKGITLKYSIDDLIIFFLTQMQNDNVIMFNTVKYSVDYNPALKFKDACDNYSKTGVTPEIINFLKEFPISKSIVWEHENELRFYKYTLKDPHINSTISPIIKNKSKMDNEQFSKLNELQKNLVKNHKFIQPKEIIFGWNANLNDLQDIVEYSKKHNIPAVKLEMLIDYQNNSFESKNIF